MPKVSGQSRTQTSFTLRDDVDKVVVVLIKPTSYDEDGFPYRFLRGVLPTNSLAAMHSLTREALGRLVPEDVEVEIHACEDGVFRHARRLRSLLKRFPEKGTRLIVGMVAVQTAQFPRACDLIDRWQSRGAECVIGGFHVSGSISTMLDGIDDPGRPGIPCPGKMPAEIQELLDKGVAVFHGEAEQVWEEALRDLLNGTPRSLYRGGMPNLEAAPLPEYPEDYFEHSFATPIGTFDTGRGCPYTCSFCTIINVQGRKNRYRRPAAILRMIRRWCETHGRASFFFTDDNFARNPQWREILQGLSELRRRGYRIRFMVEADLACNRTPDFIPLLAAAGCTQIFMGMESLNQKNLQDANKRQNKVDQFEDLAAQCHQWGIMVHAGYIVGFPHDTADSVGQDVEKLFQLGVDQASFFMLTPLPGSEDHVRAISAGTATDADLNRYDSFRPVMDHPLMSRETWSNAYRKAWRQFYRVSNMIAALKRCKDRSSRRNLLRNFVWYRWSFASERSHPMISGFYRLRDYRDRRPGTGRLSYPRFMLQEVWRHLRYVGSFFAEFYRFQHVVFETEYAPALAEKQEELSDRLRGIRDWFRLTFGKTMTRRWLNRFWIAYGRKRWHLLANPWTYRWHLYMLPFAFSEVIYTLRFLRQIQRMAKAAVG